MKDIPVGSLIVGLIMLGLAGTSLAQTHETKKDASPMSLGNLVRNGSFEYLDLTSEWKLFEFDFSVTKDVKSTDGMLSFTLDTVGALCLDDVRLIGHAAEPLRYNPRIPVIKTTNLVPNSSFEAGTDGWATLGKKTGWGGNVSGLIGRIDTKEAYDGKQSLRIELDPGKTPSTYYDCWPAVRQIQDAPLAANLGWIEVKKGQPLTLSAWMRADKAGVPAELVFKFGGVPSLPIRAVGKNVTLSDKWERYSFTTNALEQDVYVAVGPNLTGAADPSATVWIDAVQMEESAAASDYSWRLPVEVGIATGEFGDFIPASVFPKVLVSCANSAATPTTIRLTMELEDYFGVSLPAQTLVIEMPAQKRVAKDWMLKLPGTGFYRGRVNWQAGGRNQSHPIRFVTFNAYKEKDSPFGVNHAPISAELVRAMLRAGVTWGRDWSVLWGHLEPEPGKLSYDAADRQIQRLLDLGMHVVCLVPPLPSTDWNSTAPESVAPKLWHRMAYLPKDPSALFDFMTKSAARYKGKVDVLEFLNEPVWTEFCMPGANYNKPGANYSPADYMPLIKKAYPAMKAGNPGCTVIGGFSAEPWRFSTEFIKSGGLDFIDVFNVHNYGGFKSPETYIPEMKTLLGLMDKAGKRKPIWITEYAYYGLDEYPWSPWKPLASVWSHNLLLRNERQSADWSTRYNLIMLAHGTEKIFYHQGAAGEVNNGSSNVEFPLLGGEGKPLKLYAAQAITAGMLGSKPVYAGELEKPATIDGRPTKGVYGYAFQCGPKAVLAAWCVEGQAATYPLALRVPEGVDIYNIMGNRLEGRQVMLDISPVYLTSISLNADKLAKACELRAMQKK